MKNTQKSIYTYVLSKPAHFINTIITMRRYLSRIYNANDDGSTKGEGKKNERVIYNRKSSIRVAFIIVQDHPP